MVKKKVLITGAAGVLAKSIITKLKSQKDSNIFLTDRKMSSENYRYPFIQGDLSNNNLVEKLLNSFSPDIIIHIAANTDVDYCEQNKRQAILDNFVATKNLVDQIKEENVKFIYISTASVFNNMTKQFSTEKDIPTPSNFYAKTKLMSEKYITSYCNNHVIIRLGWLIGHPSFEKKFFGKIFSKIRQNSKKFFVVNDIWGTLSFADDVGDIVIKLINNNFTGILNYCTDGIVNREIILRFILNKYNLDKKIKIHSVPNDFFNLIAYRPKYELLDNSKLKKLNLIKVKNWQERLTEFLIENEKLIK